MREAAARGPVAIPQPGIPVFRRSGDDEGVEAYASMFRPLGFPASAGEDNGMKTLGEIRTLLARHREELAGSYKVQEIGIFGSYARGEQSSGSDLDVLVTFREPIGLFEFIDLENRLGELLGVKVDLVTKAALKPRIGARILSEVVYVP